MNELKRKNMMAAYTGFRGTQTLKAITDQVPEALLNRLTGAELGMVLNAINTAFHNGRASTGAELIDGELIWVPGVGGVELDAFRKIAKGEQILVFVMDNPKYQPEGVAIYRDAQEIRTELVEQGVLPEGMDQAAEEFMAACRVETIKEYPENGFFGTADEYEAALIK